MLEMVMRCGPLQCLLMRMFADERDVKFLIDHGAGIPKYIDDAIHWAGEIKGDKEMVEYLMSV